MPRLGFENPLKDLDWSIPGGEMPVRQPCPLCRTGEYGWLVSLRNHLNRKHPGLTDRQRSQISAEALRRSRFDALTLPEAGWTPK